jgi:hypothetical protein
MISYEITQVDFAVKSSKSQFASSFLRSAETGQKGGYRE